jgi:hypothetical protein
MRLLGVLGVSAALIASGCGATEPAKQGPASSGPVTAQITNALGPDQKSEAIKVFVAGSEIASVEIDEAAPTATATVTVPKPGRTEYRLEVRRQLKEGAPTTVTSTGVATFEEGSTLEVLSDDRGETYLVPAE